MENVPFFNLNDGGKIPQLGLGTYQLKGEEAHAVTEGINLGYRHIDGAFFYENQK